MNNEEWKEVEEKLKSFYNGVRLKCDGYELSIMLERMGQFKNCLMIYINGELKGEWLLKDCEEQRRFFQPVTRSCLTQELKKELKKMPKKIREEREAKAKYTYYKPYWTSFRSLKAHLIKNNNKIELVRDED
jgi:hypothetical protein